MKSSREVAFDVLFDVLYDNAYSNIALDSAQKENRLNARDGAFCTALTYGVLERLLTLDYTIRKLSSVPFRKIEPKTLVILRMGLYQIVYMSKVPDNAAVNECIELAKKKKLFKSSGYINGLLRSFIRSGSKLLMPDEQDRVKFLSVKYSCPEDIVGLWLESYGDALTEEVLGSLEGRPPMTLRVNTLTTDAESLISRLEAEGVAAEASPIDENMVEISDSGAVYRLKPYERGDFFVQDAASALCAELCSAKPGDRVIDVCSAPGGKSFNIAMNMENKGEIHAFDIHPHKIRLVESGACRLGISVIKASVRDAARDTDFSETADVVLCDVPCSGLGIIRRKPEIRYRKSEAIELLPELQYAILENSSRLVAEGGTLVYSTCTLNPEENERIVERFLSVHTEFRAREITLKNGLKHRIDEPANMITLFPCADDAHSCDGFFIALMERVEL